MIITAQKLLTLQSGMKPINNGAVVVDHGTIRAAGPERYVIKRYSSHHVHSLKYAVLMPGLVNIHTHLELPPLLVHIRAQSFPDWVLNLIRTKKGLTPGDYGAAVRQNIEMLKKTGTTTVGEICTHKVSPAFLKRSGLRAVVFHEVISMQPTAPFRFFPSSRSCPASRLLMYGISPHSPFTVSESALIKLHQLAKNRHQKLAMHVAESKDEIRLLQKRKSGLENLYRFAGWDADWTPSADSPFLYLDSLGLLGPGFLAVHAVQATGRDIYILSKSHTPVAHCPRSNKATNVGRMPLKKFLDAGITVGLGTDSLASSPSLNMWDEMRYALSIHRRDGVTAQDIFWLATIGGAKALGMNHAIGTLAPGKRADIIAVPLPKKNTGDLYSDLLRETKSGIMTMVGGKIIYRDHDLG
jgi:cytosine/adenosine deaminase-related metal-dependent hydrolase